MATRSPLSPLTQRPTDPIARLRRRASPKVQATQSKAMIDTIPVAVVLDETHTRAAEVTQHPIEGGGSVSDHRIRKPDVLRMTGIVLPTGASSATSTAATTNTTTGDAPAINDDYRALLDLETRGAPFVVVTGLRTYPNMLFEDLTITRNKDTGAVISFSATFRQITYADSRTVTVHAEPAKTRGKKDLGAQATKTNGAKKAEEKMRSTLSRAFTKSAATNMVEQSMSIGDQLSSAAAGFSPTPF